MSRFLLAVVMIPALLVLGAVMFMADAAPPAKAATSSPRAQLAAKHDATVVRKCRAYRHPKGHRPGRSFCWSLVLAARAEGQPRRVAANRHLLLLLGYEAGYDYTAFNRRSGACRWFQLLPCNKYPSRRCTQGMVRHARCGLHYVESRYGSARAAMDHFRRIGWY